MQPGDVDKNWKIESWQDNANFVYDSYYPRWLSVSRMKGAAAKIVSTSLAYPSNENILLGHCGALMALLKTRNTY